MRWLPRSLLGRVYALYAATLVAVTACGLALFLWQQVSRQVEDSREDARALVSLATPTITDSAVIGDYDTIRRQLESLARHSMIDAADFRDPKGGHLHGGGRGHSRWAPAWLLRWVGGQLGDTTHEVAAGGVVYGELRVTLAAAAMAGQLWLQTVWAVLLSIIGVAAGLVLIRAPLHRWLGQLERIGELGQGLEGGQQLARRAMRSDAPVEFRRTFEVLNRAAASLQEQREQAAATLQAIDDAVFACSVDGRVLLANEAAQRLWRRPLDALIGRSLAELLPALGESNATDARWQHRQLSWADDDGGHHVLDTNLSPITDADGRAAGRVLACRDVTEQHRLDQAMRSLNAARDAALSGLRRTLEEHAGVEGQPREASLGDIEAVSSLVSRLVARLHEHAGQLDAIFALSPDGFVSFDAEHCVRYSSPGFTRLTGLTPEMVVGLEQDVFLLRLGSRCPSRLEAARLEPLLAGEDGGRRVTLSLARPARRIVEVALHAGRARAVSQVLHLRDVTRETEVDRMKSEFVAAAAHELRTPMVGIYGYSELLITRELPPERHKGLLTRIHRQCEVMVDILNEMLDLARLEARQDRDFDYVATTLDAVVERTLADFCPPAERGAPRWSASGVVVPVRVDLAKIERALRNLLSNAYKYSPAGGPVDVHVRHDPSRQRVGVAVSDHGIGMTPEQMARVGERFYRADDSGTVLGTGLGVSLVREILALHGGEVALQSTPGQGTTATLWLPALRETLRTGEAVPVG